MPLHISDSESHNIITTHVFADIIVTKPDVYQIISQRVKISQIRMCQSLGLSTCGMAMLTC